jgi:hypothetical protein
MPKRGGFEPLRTIVNVDVARQRRLFDSDCGLPDVG